MPDARRRRGVPVGPSLNLLVPPGGGETTPGLEFYKQLFDNLYDGVYYVDFDRRIRFWNRGAERITGYSAREVVGRCCDPDLLDQLNRSGCLLCEGECPLQRAVETGEPSSERVYLRHKDGRRIVVEAHVMPVRTEQGAIVGAVEVFRDASSVVALETALAKLRELAMKDPLTGLANRRHVAELLTFQVQLYQNTGIPFSVLMADIDHFKRINDTWGHPVGDKVLVRFAELLQRQCRAGDVVGRIGGEEFLILLPEARLEAARSVAERFREAVAAQAAPPELPPRSVTISIGVAEIGLDDDGESLLARADVALYRAKRQGRNRVEAEASPPAGAAPHAVDGVRVCLKTSSPARD